VLRCHIAAFAALGGVLEEILYDRMKTAVTGEDETGVVTYNAALVALLNHYGAGPRACQPYRAKTKGKVERPFRYIRQDFFLARTFRDIDDLNAQFEAWRMKVANPRVHATTRRVETAFAEEQPSLKPLPPIPYSAVLTVERRVSKEGMISAGGNFYSVPDTTRRRTLEVQHNAEDFIRRAEVVHFLGPPGTGKSHLATALGVAAVKFGRSVYRATLAELITALNQAEREGRLADMIRFFARAALLIVDEIGYLPITTGGANLFFQLINARYEKGP